MPKTIIRALISRILFVTAAGCSVQAVAQDIIWELGAGAANFSLDLYPGSASKKHYLVPLPYFTLISTKIEIDRGIRGFLFKSDTVLLDVSADFGIPVDSDDSAVRKGMPNLDAVLQLGPSLEVLLHRSESGHSNIRFELPLRAAIASDIKNTSNEGWLLEPRLTFEKKRLHKAGLSTRLMLGLKYATRDYNAYYYDVAPMYATPERPVYASDKGYGGAFVSLQAGWREGNWVWWTLLQYQSLSGAVYEDSPLVEEKDYYLFGVGFAWIFAQSL
ncbi:MAG: MipA/OmpV family protein [Gammaproteobacteria bacterium]|nr:MipA/OmpV family protein [Gammaproteobacteria bacterium]